MKIKTKKKKTRGSSSSSSESSDRQSSDFHTAVARIAVAQICHSVGYRRAETTALKTLTDVAVKYIQTLAESTATSATSTGRTQCNLLDFICALEDLHSGIGFHGNSEPKRRLYPLSDSSILVDMMKFVNRIREIPFAKPLPRRCQTLPVNQPCFSGESSRSNHIPRWLPAFPENEITDGGEKPVVNAAVEGEIACESVREISKLPEIRKKVSFKISGGGGGCRSEIEIGFGVDLRSGVCKGGKRVSCQLFDDEKKPKIKMT